MYKSQNTKSEITLLHLESSFWGCQKWSLLLFSLYLLCCYTLLSVCVGHAAFILMVRSLVLVHLLKKNAGFTFFLGFTHLIRGSPVVWLSKSVFEVSTFLQCAYVIVSVMSPVNHKEFTQNYSVQNQIIFYFVVQIVYGYSYFVAHSTSCGAVPFSMPSTFKKLFNHSCVARDTCFDCVSTWSRHGKLRSNLNRYICICLLLSIMLSF